MLQPSFSPDLSPLPDYVGVDESQITLSRHVREVGFYGGTIGINSETHTMFPLSVVALAAAGTSLEQVKDWYGADPESARSQAIDNAYERLGMTTPEGVQARVANTWRSGQLYVARQVRLPHRSSPKVRRLPEDPLTVLGGLSMGVDSEKLGAWAAERNTSVERLLAEVKLPFNLENNAAAISLGFMALGLKAQRGRVMVAGFGSIASNTVASRRSLLVARVKAGRELGKSEHIVSIPDFYDIRVDTDRMTASVGLDDARITFNYPGDMGSVHISSVTCALLGMPSEKNAATHSVSSGHFSRVLGGVLKTIDLRQENPKNGRALCVLKNFIAEGLVDYRGLTEREATLPVLENNVYGRLLCLESPVEIAESLGLSIFSIRKPLANLRSLFDVASHHELLLAVATSKTDRTVAPGQKPILTRKQAA